MGVLAGRSLYGKGRRYAHIRVPIHARSCTNRQGKMGSVLNFSFVKNHSLATNVIHMTPDMTKRTMDVAEDQAMDTPPSKRTATRSMVAPRSKNAPETSSRASDTLESLCRHDGE